MTLLISVSHIAAPVKESARFTSKTKSRGAMKHPLHAHEGFAFVVLEASASFRQNTFENWIAGVGGGGNSGKARMHIKALP